MGAPEPIHMPAPRATLERKRGPGQTKWRITGTLKQVLAEIETLFIEYPAQGYGTSVMSMHMPGYSDYEAIVTHRNSCD